jgi:hypothetical protein
MRNANVRKRRPWGKRLDLKANRPDRQVLPAAFDALAFLAFAVGRRAGEYPFPQRDSSAYRNGQVVVGLQILTKQSDRLGRSDRLKGAFGVK